MEQAGAATTWMPRGCPSWEVNTAAKRLSASVEPPARGVVLRPAPGFLRILPRCWRERKEEAVLRVPDTGPGRRRRPVPIWGRDRHPRHGPGGGALGGRRYLSE